MKTTIFQLYALALTAGMLVGGTTQSAQARLGETKEQLIERYGEPLRDARPELSSSEGATVFFKDTVEVHVEFKSGEAWMVTYRMHKLTSDLEAQFRDANDGEAGVGDWHEPTEHLGRTYWATTDGEVFGVRYFIGNGQIYRFCTSKCRDALLRDRKMKIDSAIANGVTDPAADAPAAEPEEEAEPKEENPF